MEKDSRILILTTYISMQFCLYYCNFWQFCSKLSEIFYVGKLSLSA